MLSINTNLDALMVQENINNSQNKYSKAIEQISSGLRINSAGDDPAGLGTLDSLNNDLAGTNQAASNVGQATSFLQSADAGMSSMVTLLNQMYSLAVESNSASSSSTSDGYSNTVYQADITALSGFVSNTNYNGINLLSSGNSFTFQTGTASGTVSTITLTGLSTAINSITATSVASASSAVTAQTAILSVISQVDTMRAAVGAQEQQFQAISSFLQSTATALNSSISTVGDANIAQQTTNLTTAQVLEQSANAMLAQANSQPAQVLTLLR